MPNIIINIPLYLIYNMGSHAINNLEKSKIDKEQVKAVQFKYMQACLLKKTLFINFL